MISVDLTVDPLNGPRSSMKKAMEVSSWLSAQGLEFLVDYEWATIKKNDKQVLVINFADHCQEMSTLFALTWVK